MRRFWLKRGDRIWDLSSKDLSLPSANFMADPQGLGVKVKVESYEVERATFIENVKLESTEISGKIYFDGYNQFTVFASFIGYIETTEPLRLYYSTAEQKPDYNSVDEWYRLVLIKELKKGEIDVKMGKLICDIKFIALSPWKQDKINVLELDMDKLNLSGGGLPYIDLDIKNTGNLPTPCTIKVEAETDTPSFILYRNGAPFERGQYNVVVRQGYHMIINSDPIAQEASLYRETSFPVDDDRQEIYHLGEHDYKYSNFITIPSGNSTFRFSAKNTPFGKVTLSYSLQKDLI